MSSRLRQWDDNFVWHPFAPMQAFREEQPPLIIAADGFHLVDEQGRRYLDGISSLWCNVHGHRVPEIDAAIREQLDHVAHTTLLGLASGPSAELAAELVRITPPGLNKVFYSDSGATAVEIAVKMAYQYHAQTAEKEPRRNLFVCMGNAYHGDTIGSVSVGGMELFHGVYCDLLFETIQVPSPVAFRRPVDIFAEDHIQSCIDTMETLLREHHDRIAAFIIEPLVQGAAGILVHPPGYLRRVRELTHELGILLIADEVAVGFGRTGTMFACEQEEVSPDLMCLAKGLTGGYLPLAATLATDEIFNAFLGRPEEGRTFYHGHTFTGNPLGCAAALASLKLFEENAVLVNTVELANTIATELKPLAHHTHVGEIRQKGIMIGIELVRDRRTNEPFDSKLRMGHQVALAARKRDVIIRPLGDVVVLMPAPAMPSSDVEHLCRVVIESIDEVITNFSAT